MPATSRHKIHNPRADWVLPIVILFTLAAVIIGVYLVTGMLNDDPRAGSTQPRASTQPGAGAVVPPTLSREQMLDNARRLKPLEDLEEGDRVLYKGRVYTWESWHKSIDTSRIRSVTGKEFEVPTGRLTPVEYQVEVPAAPTSKAP
jgi:hypothetical protein